MSTKLAKIAIKAKQNPKTVFTSLYHLLNEELLLLCHQELEAGKATGVDEVTKAEYEENLKENISALVKKLKTHSYRPQPVRRIYIPKGKGKGKVRPLGIPAYEDKLVQLGLKKILEPIYEAIFLDISYGFRPGLSCHDALKKLNIVIEKQKISYVVDADIKGFFDNVNHEWLMKFIGVNIADPNIKRLIVRFLKAGIIEDGELTATEQGTPQGAIISPLLANIYLHYVLDLWFMGIIGKHYRINGEAEIVRYADDYVCCFQYKRAAEIFFHVLKKRLAKFGLALAEDKSKIIEFGRFAASNSRRLGRGKPETFDFLGFTHYCSTSRKGRFRVKRRTMKKKINAKIVEFTRWIKLRRNMLTTNEIVDKVKSKLRGHYQYYGITDNSKSIDNFRQAIIRILFKWLNRRSQRKSFIWEKFKKYIIDKHIPKARICVNIYG
ncbi:group II intron reverse transcriptase/maturase [Iocasia frigidifontis]|uniref:Group II intron reverse transcriptase/maturase n=1 Tax=Iocasia fonsfrigidae TaxID=2682810 RepID=A0A8A7K7U7_9FIRM|nr:group II intron reverse transcriptase/maturase [Iocasia fonsfrigidae]QTL97796.1 group II intron reverse transcriptase/maturase [Iocasia fonsfrigidae]